MKLDDGGPAFPYVVPNHPDWEYGWVKGMSLRAWLAGQAIPTVRPPALGFTPQERALAARECVRLADAVLAELRKEQSNG